MMRLRFSRFSLRFWASKFGEIKHTSFVSPSLFYEKFGMSQCITNRWHVVSFSKLEVSTYAIPDTPGQFSIARVVLRFYKFCNQAVPSLDDRKCDSEVRHSGDFWIALNVESICNSPAHNFHCCRCVRWNNFSLAVCPYRQRNSRTSSNVRRS